MSGEEWARCMHEVNRDPEDAEFWYRRGRHGGAMTDDNFVLTVQDCYELAVEADSCHAEAWFSLGCLGGGTAFGRVYTEKECLEEALAADPKMAMAWMKLSVVGGGLVGGRFQSGKQCHEQAVATASARPESGRPPINFTEFLRLRKPLTRVE